MGEGGLLVDQSDYCGWVGGKHFILGAGPVVQKKRVRQTCPIAQCDNKKK